MKLRHFEIPLNLDHHEKLVFFQNLQYFLQSLQYLMQE
jgi:hypothetical protein